MSPAHPGSLSCVRVLQRGRWGLSRVEDLERPGIYPGGRMDSPTSAQHVLGDPRVLQGEQTLSLGWEAAAHQEG